MSNIRPLVLCGGVGTRLWPLSRMLQPKQFQPIDGEGSLTFFQATVQRYRSRAFSDPWICVAQDHLKTVRRQLRDIQCSARIIAEPVARNTGPAVLSAALAMHAEDPDAVLVVLPADHVIKGDLNQRFTDARPAVEGGMIVTFGIAPRYPEPGYGYIIDGGEIEAFPGMHSVAAFVEKPEESRAAALIDTGHAYWASGISMFRADTIIEEYRRLDPETFVAVSSALLAASRAGAEMVLAGDSFEKARNEPTERAVFEHSPRVALAPAKIEWDDVGAWAAFHTVGNKTVEGNVTSGDVLMIDTSNSFVRGGERLVAVVGMSDVVVVDTRDAVLVTTRQSSQKVKKVVERLADLKRREVVDHSRWAMDWGQLVQLASGNGFELHLFNVNPGAIVTLDPLAGHRRLITIGEGRATLEIDDVKHVLLPGRTLEIGADQAAFLHNHLGSALQLISVTCAVADPGDAFTPMLESITKLGKREYA